MSELNTHPSATWVESLYFVVQPVMAVEAAPKQASVAFYELLLRNKETQRFPNYFLDKIQERHGNAEFLYFAETQLMALFKQYPGVKFSLNFESCQWQFPETAVFFDNMKAYNDLLMIELTERIYNMDDFDHLEEAFSMMHDLQYQVLLDDISTGQNNIQVLFKHIHELCGVKFSKHPFLNIADDVMMPFLEAYVNVCSKANLMFVIEEIENCKEAKVFLDKGMFFQQGWYWSKPMHLSQISS